MAFVEAMAIEVSRVTIPDRPILQTPFPVAHLRRGHRAVRLGQAGRPVRDGAGRPRLGAGRAGRQPVVRASACSTTRSAAGGRVKAIVAPGMAGITRREIDELTERAKRFGAKGLAYLALEAGGEIKSPIAKFLSDETQRADHRADRRQRGRPDPDRRRHARRHRRRPRAAARRARRPARPGRPERPRPTSGSTASRCTSGTRRTAAGTRPTTRSAASCPRTRRCS